jgi:hypothetical protein
MSYGFKQGDRVKVTDDDGDLWPGVVSVWPQGTRGEWWQVPVIVDELPDEVLNVDRARVTREGRSK